MQEALGPDGVLLNVSCGSTVDEPALIAVLQNRTIKAAGLDVFGMSRTSMRASSSWTMLSRSRTMRMAPSKPAGQLARDNLAAHFAGEPLVIPVV